jgi:uncharacterized protein
MIPEQMTRAAMLYDFYGQLLTDKQREFWELYYHQDLSLGEIAEEYGVSRQAVFDLLKRTEKILIDYEAKLALVSKYMLEREKIEQVIEDIVKIKKTQDISNIDQIIQDLKTLLD